MANAPGSILHPICHRVLIEPFRRCRAGRVSLRLAHFYRRSDGHKPSAQLFAGGGDKGMAKTPNALDAQLKLQA